MKDADDQYYSNPRDKAANDVYSLFFIGWLLGFVTFIIGLVMALVQRDKGNDFTRSHFCYQITMAWQGFLIFSLLFALCFGVHLAFMMKWLTIVCSIICTVAFLYWWLKRNFMGYRLLSAHRAISNVHSWGMPYALSDDKEE